MKNNIFKAASFFFAFITLICLPGCTKSLKSKKGNVEKRQKTKTVTGKKHEPLPAEQLTSSLEIEQKIKENPKDINLKILLAKAYDNEGKFIKSKDVYHELSRLYTSDKKKNDSFKYHEILALQNEALSLSPDCDSTSLNQTLEAANKYLETSATGEFSNEVRGIIFKCKERLLTKNINMFDFYLRKNNIKSATHVLEKIESNFVDQNKQLIPKINYLKCKLAKAKKENNFVNQTLAMMIEEYPDSLYTRRIEGLSKSATAITT